MAHAKQKNKPTETSSEMQLNDKSRSVLYIFLFHALNVVSIVEPNVLDMDEQKDF